MQPMKYLPILIFAFMVTYVACDLIPAIAPPDWPEPPQDTITLPIDTLPTDTCTDPQEIEQPAFVTAYMDITDILQTDRQIIIGNGSAWIYNDNIDHMGQIIDSLWEAYRPEYSYKTHVKPSDSRRLFTIIEGTNDREQFYLKAQIRFNGYKQYFGFGTQHFVFFDCLTAEQASEIIAMYPSVNYFNWYGTEFDSVTVDKLSRQILGYCKKGRWKADFRFSPVSDTLVQDFINADWDNVLHN